MSPSAGGFATNTALATIVVAAFASSGCAWNGYLDAPSDEPRQAVSAGGIRAEVYLVQPTEDERQILREALSTTFEILGSDAFAEALSRSCWIESVDGPGIQPSELLRVLRETDYSGLQLLVNPQYRAIAVAQTRAGTCDSDHHGISISPDRVALWRREEVRQRAMLIDTIAHELTHVREPVDPDGSCPRFQDRGHAGNERYLVSYRVGRTAACVYLHREGVVSDVDRCVEEMRLCGGTWGCRRARIPSRS